MLVTVRVLSISHFYKSLNSDVRTETVLPAVWELVAFKVMTLKLGMGWILFWPDIGPTPDIQQVTG